MAKTIMVSNVAYEELRKLKEEDKSFSDVIIGLFTDKKSNKGANLRNHLGVLKGDKEYDIIQKELKAAWHKWTKRYAK